MAINTKQQTWKWFGIFKWSNRSNNITTDITAMHHHHQQLCTQHQKEHQWSNTRRQSKATALAAPPVAQVPPTLLCNLHQHYIKLLGGGGRGNCGKHHNENSRIVPVLVLVLGLRAVTISSTTTTKHYCTNKAGWDISSSAREDRCVRVISCHISF